MTFRFETDYDLETLTAMAKGIRRTVRKKRHFLLEIRQYSCEKCLAQRKSPLPVTS